MKTTESNADDLENQKFSPRNLEIQWADLRNNEIILAIQKSNLFASAFIHYFYQNPDAILFVVGTMSDYANSYNDFSEFECSVFRIDSDYIKAQARIKNKSLGEYEKIDSKYKLDAKYLKHNFLSSYDDVPNGIADLYVESFSKFNNSQNLMKLWDKIGGTEIGGHIYGSHNLSLLLSYFENGENMKANIEKYYLQASIQSKSEKQKKSAL